MAAVALPVSEEPLVVVPRTISVVIVVSSIDRWSELAAAVDQLGRQVQPPDQIVVVVDHDDELLERVADTYASGVGETEVVVVANVDRSGVAGSRNLGFSWSTGEVVAFLAENAVPDDVYWVATLMEDYGDADVAGVGGGATARWAATAPAWLPEELAWTVDCSFTGLPTDVEPVRDLLDGNLSFRRDVFEEVGGFRELTGDPADGAEADLCDRIHRRYASARLLFDPDLDVSRHLDPDQGDFATFARRCWRGGFSAPSALGAEREYLTRVLPAAVARGVGDGLRGRVHGFQQAGAIVVGTACSTAGDVRRRLTRRR